MPTINEMIDFCEDMAAYDCFSNEQFARREMFYAISDELKKTLREQKRPHGEWIPVEERLPRYNEYVLVYRPEMAIKIIVDCYDEGWTYSKDDAVVAWMPLPKPYEEEGEEE